MPLTSLLKFDLAGRFAIGVSVSLKSDSKPVYSYCVIRVKSNKIEILQKGNHLTEEECYNQVNHWLQRGVRLHMNFSGNGILIKQFDGTDHIDNVISRSFPFVSVNELLGQVLVGVNQYVTITKRKIFYELSFLSKYIYSCSLGPFVVASIQAYLPIGTYQVEGYCIGISSDSIILLDEQNCIDNAQDIKLGKNTLAPTSILPFASANQIITPHQNLLVQVPEEYIPSRKDFVFLNRYFKIARSSLIMFSIVLMIAIIVNSFLANEVKDLSMHLETKTKVINNNSYKSEIDTKLSNLMMIMGWSHNIVPIFYADQIATTIPSTVKLTFMEVGTFSESKLDKSVNLKSEEILIRGQAKTPADVQRWIMELESLDWILEIKNRSYDMKEMEAYGNFEFLIIVNESFEN